MTARVSRIALLIQPVNPREIKQLVAKLP